MFMPIEGAATETFSTLFRAIVRVDMLKKIAPVRFTC